MENLEKGFYDVYRTVDSAQHYCPVCKYRGDDSLYSFTNYFWTLKKQPPFAEVVGYFFN